jgi:DNA-binding transcriptional regulator GbsR (MarR family)
MSPKPLTFDDLIERLQLSNGAASEGLKYLRDLGAVRVVEMAGARRTHYEALDELKKLAGLFLRRRMEPHLSEGKARLEEIAEKAEQVQGEAREHILARIKLLDCWAQNASRMLPFLLETLGGQ